MKISKQYVTPIYILHGNIKGRLNMREKVCVHVALISCNTPTALLAPALSAPPTHELLIGAQIHRYINTQIDR
jgi:hypothetical protein